MSNACFSQVSSADSGWLARAALTPPWAAPEWLRPADTCESIATSIPAASPLHSRAQTGLPPTPDHDQLALDHPSTPLSDGGSWSPPPYEVSHGQRAQVP